MDGRRRGVCWSVSPQPNITLSDAGELLLERDGGAVAVRAARSFPWTAPDAFIVLRDAATEEATEVLTIRDLADLPAEARSALEAWLARNTFIPKVTRVIEVRPGNAALLFHVDTDRGEQRIRVLEREDLRTLSDGRTLAKDPDGVVYEFPPFDQLDEESQRQLRLVL